MKKLPLNASIDELGLHWGIVVSLKYGGIRTIQDLLSHDKEYFLKIRNIGAKKIQIIGECLAQYNYNFCNGDYLMNAPREEEKEALEELTKEPISLDSNISELLLPNRIYFILIRENIKTVGELICHPKEYFLDLEGLGTKSYLILERRIKACNLSFINEPNFLEKISLLKDDNNSKELRDRYENLKRNLLKYQQSQEKLKIKNSLLDSYIAYLENLIENLNIKGNGLNG